MKTLVILLLICLFAVLTNSTPYANVLSPGNVNQSASSLNITLNSTESLNKSYVEWWNHSSSNYINLSMTNSSPTYWSYSFSNLSDNTYNYTVWLQNTTGNWGYNGTYSVIIDSQPPNVTIVQPKGNISNFTLVEVFASINDSVGVDRVKFFLENSSGNYTRIASIYNESTNISDLYPCYPLICPALDETYYSNNIVVNNFLDGIYTLWVKVNDTLNNTAYNNTQIRIDKTVPLLSALKINDTAPTKNTSFIIEGTYNETNLKNITLEILYPNSSRYKIQEMDRFPSLNRTNTTFTISRTGNYTLRVNVTDGANNTASLTTFNYADNTSSSSLFVDSSAPQAVINSPGQWTSLGNGTNLTVVINLTDHYSLNTSSIGVWLNNWSITYNNKIINSSLFQLNFTNSTLRPDMTYIINVTASDNLGNTLNETIGNFTIDDIPPNKITDLALMNTTYTTILSNHTVKSNNVTINWSFVSDNYYVSRYDIYYRNRSFNSTSGSFNAWGSWLLYTNVSSQTNVSVLENLTDSYDYQIKVNPVDATNNSNSSNIVNVTVDLYGPSFSVLNGTFMRTPVRWTNETNLTIYVNISDVSGISNTSINVAFNGSVKSFTLFPTTNNQSVYRISFNVTYLQNNTNYTVTINATDIFDRTNSSLTYNISTDFSPPNVTLENRTAPYYSSWYKDYAIVRVNCTDDISGPAYYLSNESSYGSWIHNTSSNYDFTINENGQKSYIFKCRDRAGNVASAYRVFSVDAQDPSIDSNTITPSSGASGVSTTATISADYSDSSGSGINTSACTLKIRSTGSWSTISSTDFTASTVTAVKTLNTNTVYTVQLIIYDRVGHQDSYSWSFSTADTSTSNSDSGGSDSTTDSVKYLSIALTREVTMNVGETKTLPIYVDNDGTSDLSAVVFSFTGNINHTLSPLSADIAAGQTVTVTLTLNATKSGNVTATFSAAGTGVSASDTMKIIVLGETKDFTVSGPTELNLAAGNVSLIELSVKNTGSVDLSDMNIDVSGKFNLSYKPSTITSLKSGATEKILFNLSVPESTEEGLYKQIINFSSENITKSHEIKIKIQPTESKKKSINATLAELKNKIEAARERLNKVNESNSTSYINAKADLDNATALLQEAITYLAAGDYVSASALKDKIETRLNSFNENMKKISPSSFFRLLILYVALSVIIIAVVLLGYLYVYPWYKVRKNTSSDIKNSIMETYSKIQNYFQEEESMENKEKEDHVTVKKKKISFDEEL